MNTLQELVKHMKKYQDTVFIVGKDILSNDESFYSDLKDFSEKYCRKEFRRKPEECWDYYMKNIYRKTENNDVYKILENLIKSNEKGCIIDQNINSPTISNKINLHGNVAVYKCDKCKTIYPVQYVLSKEPYKNECDACGRIIRPTVLFYNESYDVKDFNTIKEKISNTHTLFLIGTDFKEEEICNLVADYGDIRDKERDLNNNERVLVSIQKDDKFDPNDITFFEFLVVDNIKDALDRFLKEYNI